jgi:hypothetical protein
MSAIAVRLGRPRSGAPSDYGGSDDRTNTRAGLFLQPMVSVEQRGAAVSFYESLGAHVLHGGRDGDFVMLKVGGARLGRWRTRRTLSSTRARSS